MDILNFLVEPLTLPFMLRAFVVTVIAAAVCALLSCWLVLLGWSLMGDAISHAVLPGVVLAYIFGAPFAVGAVIAALLAVALIGGVRRSGRVREDAAIGIVFTTMFAFGLVLISVTPSNTDLNHILFGNVLGVSWSDVWQVAILAVVVAAVLLVKRRDFVLYAFDPGFAQAVGLRPRLLGALLLIMLALTSVVALQIVGVVLAYIFGAPFAVGAVIAALLAVALIGGVRRSGRVREDAAIGIVFTTMFAFGLVLISVTPSNTDLNHILFGNVLGVSWSDVWQVAVLAVVVAAVLMVKRRDFVLYAFDPGFAQAVGLRPRLLGALLLIMLALTSVVALQIVGVVLVVAMLVIPGSTARLITDRFVPMLAVSVGVSLVGTLTGLYASYYADVSPGGAVVVTQGILFALAYVFAPRYGLLGRMRARRLSTAATKTEPVAS